MSKKDFILIAKIINSLKTQNRLLIAKEFANQLRQTNQKFKYDIFIDACIKGEL